MNNLTESQEAFVESRWGLLDIVTESLEAITHELRESGLKVNVEPYRGIHENKEL